VAATLPSVQDAHAASAQVRTRQKPRQTTSNDAEHLVTNIDTVFQPTSDEMRSTTATPAVQEM
jgi:hypothetical protein